MVDRNGKNDRGVGRDGLSPPMLGSFPQLFEVDAQSLASFDDPARIDQTWSRLSESVARRSLPRRLAQPLSRQFLVAAVVLAAFVGGVYFERAQAGSWHDAQRDASGTLAAAELPTLDRAGVATPRPAAGRTGDEMNPAREANDQSPPLRFSLPPVARHAAPSVEHTAEVQGPLNTEDAVPVAGWLRLAAWGDYAGAYVELDHDGGFDAVLRSGSPEELMTVADVARFAGRQGRAVQALRAVVEQHPGDENAPIAAMMLGNLLSRSGDRSGAREAYEANRALSPGGDFAEDALVREFELALAAGDLPELKRLRRQYESEFPTGRHLSKMAAHVEGLEPVGTAQAKEPSSARQNPYDVSPPR